ncbi:hypothetical protein J1G42_02080 [Cellulomonas sp. zg-ZUI222]|uniref:DUF3592 domain-containing protein n=1 Tax=Cellulomonas wangleii TaxID=2816956 RepID=A0ABX8D470_9CELL|nr:MULTISPECIES: hypothetical protein [Cellulomonas]MBO0898750.1 hypothetical protein [Cellulomonas sp. zg-ZUI22]MBO0919611.1 hypothetical protein [Cellulomonas wangleii]MBO0923962.1 hypothetical protein [Cellulomonas wangleii]MBO0924244.1 hypothetical protein [Cellulomonas wangleii]QVI62256.1 hypothetical protein KG103_17920 [Cellulomonas wangleii]
MATSTLLALACVGALVLGVVLAVRGSRALRAARAVPRVRVPARPLSSMPSPGGEVLEVEYPGPDGSLLRSRMQVFRVRGPGVQYGFDGTVWVDPTRPTDVTPRPQGRTAGAVTTIVVAAVVLVLAFAAGVAAGVVRFAESLPS